MSKFNAGDIVEILIDNKALKSIGIPPSICLGKVVIHKYTNTRLSEILNRGKRHKVVLIKDCSLPTSQQKYYFISENYLILKP